MKKGRFTEEKLSGCSSSTKRVERWQIWLGALEYYAQAHPLHRTSGERRGEANTLNNMAAIHREFDCLTASEELLNLLLVATFFAQLDFCPEV